MRINWEKICFYNEKHRCSLIFDFNVSKCIVRVNLLMAKGIGYDTWASSILQRCLTEEEVL